MKAPGTKEMHAASLAVSALLQHRGILPGPLVVSLNEVQSHLSDLLCPYSIEELDANKKKLDERWPEYERWYIRCGSVVTWCDRRRARPGDGGLAPGDR